MRVGMTVAGEVGDAVAGQVGRAWRHALDGKAVHRPSQVACPAAKHAHVHEPSGLALVALTKRGQVPLQRPCSS